MKAEQPARRETWLAALCHVAHHLGEDVDGPREQPPPLRPLTETDEERAGYLATAALFAIRSPRVRAQLARWGWLVIPLDAEE